MLALHPDRDVVIGVDTHNDTHMSAYDLICRSPYDLMCRSVSAR